MTRLTNNNKLSGIANKITQRARLILAAEHFPIVFMLFFLIVLGILFTGDYSQSWDEKQLRVDYKVFC